VNQQVAMPSLSVVIITKNAAAHIADCLASVTFADEIIVLDSGSHDNTLGICRQFTEKVFINTDWPGFGIQKNRALNYARSDWVLSLDADEQVTPALQQAIQRAIQQSTATAFKIPRHSCYCGQWIKYSGWQADYVTRLFRRDCARFSDDLVHERLQVLHGNVGTLTAPLLHFSFDSLEDVLNKVNTYSSASAQMLYTRGQRGSVGKAILHGLWAFIRTYLLKRGFLDGRAGFLLAISNAEGTYYRYIKLMYLQENTTSKQPKHLI